MRLFTWGMLLATGLLVACGPSGRNGGGDDDDDGVDAGNTGGDGGNNPVDNCSEEAKLVYVVDSDDTFSKFDPMTKTFTDLGKLDACAAGFGASPFSMGVDREAFAWILYSDDKLFRMDVKDLATCSRTNWSSPNNLRDFGMGFSTDAVGGTSDTLFVAGGSSGPTTGNSALAAVDTGALTATGVGSIDGWPELTGTANAELWGFFPSTGTNPRISKIDKTNGMMVTNFPLDSLSGTPSAWAFAAWGGDFWVFLQRSNESSTKVYQVDGMTGAIESTTTANGRNIVGAGVSTCAPVIVQ